MGPLLKSPRLLAVVLLLSILGQLALGGHSVQPDELGLWGLNPAGGERALLLKALLVERMPPLVALYGWLLQRVLVPAGVPPQLPSMLLAALSVLLVYALGRRLLSAQVALVGAALFALSPVLLWFATVSNAALLPMVLGLALCLSAYRLADGGSWWGAGLGYVLFGLAFSLSHAFGLLFVACFSLLARLSRMPGERGLHLGGLIVLLGWGGYAWFVLEGAAPVLTEGTLGSLVLHDWSGLFLGWLGSGRSFAPVLEASWSSASGLGAARSWLAVAMQLLLAVLLVRGLMTLLRSQHFEQAEVTQAGARQPASAHLIALVLVLPLGMLVGSFFGGAKSVQPVELLPVLPFFMLLLAAGLAVGHGHGRRLAIALGLGLLLKADLLALALQPGAWCVDEPRADWVAAAEHLGDELDEGTPAREVYVAYGEGHILRHFDARLAPRDWRERLATLAEELAQPPAASWLGAPGLAALDELELGWEQAWEARAMSVLGIEVSPLRRSGVSRSDRLPFFLLFKQHAGQDFYRRHPLLLPPILQDLTLEAQPIGDPTLDQSLPSPALLRILETHHFDSLVLLKLGWVS